MLVLFVSLCLGFCAFKKYSKGMSMHFVRLCLGDVCLSLSHTQTSHLESLESIDDAILGEGEDVTFSLCLFALPLLYNEHAVSLNDNDVHYER